MAGKIVIVPNGDVRSIIQTDKGLKYATIHSGKFEVVADITNEGRIIVTREILDALFDVVEPDEPALAERLGVTEDDLDEAGV